MSRFLIGIDLGTTNSALAYIDLKTRPKDGSPPIHTFNMPQLIGPGLMGTRLLLPSFVYIPGDHDLPPSATALPWQADARLVVGEFARNHGAKVPARLVSSAKSWLCHPGVDRTQPLLPIAAPPEITRLSPLEVSRRYLAHMAAAWNHTHPAADEKLELQTIVLTVPASFDDMARALTQQAAHEAGLKNVMLLEEPQAAFYCWLGKSPAEEITRMRPGMRCLVVDVGGGTSDFSLIHAAEEKGELSFLRDSVGDHLLLGGDNMDLALARQVESKMPQAGRLDATQLGQLIQACRGAKEALLGPKPPASVPITILGRGRSVIGGTLHSTLTSDDIQRVFFDGFLPSVPRDAKPRNAQSGLQEMGLPYVSDAAITKHLAAFLSRQSAENVSKGPETILFNGGVFQPQSLRDRLLEVMHSWYDASWQPLVLANPSLDLAVAWGAAFAGWLRFTGGKRIGGGIPRSYYLGIDNGNDNSNKVLCVVPRHLEEGQEIRLEKPELELALGEPVLFPLYSSTVRGDDKPGDLVSVVGDSLLQLPPMHTVLRGGKRAGVKRVPVIIAARSTEIGTLELFCEAKDGGNRWRLEFNVREVLRQVSTDEPDAASQSLSDLFPESLLERALDRIRGTWQTPPASDPKELVKALELDLETGKEQWPTSVCRRLWNALEEVAPERRRSPGHLQRWYNLAGYVLRPGYGDPLDRYRVESMWRMLATPSSKGGASITPDGGADYWIMWRRVAGGLSLALQQTLMTKLKPMLLPSKGKPTVKPAANELAEMWRCAASLERLDTSSKQQLGNVLLQQLKGTVPSYIYWSLTRLGARQLLYGPLNSIIHHSVIERWIPQLTALHPATDQDKLGIAFALTQFARRTGNRATELDEEMRDLVAEHIKDWTIPTEWRDSLYKVHDMQGADSARMFGEALPIGLRVRQE